MNNRREESVRLKSNIVHDYILFSDNLHIVAFYSALIFVSEKNVKWD